MLTKLLPAVRPAMAVHLIWGFSTWAKPAQELTAYLEHEGQILRFEVTNKSLTTGVSITKTGPREATAGQPVNYWI